MEKYVSDDKERKNTKLRFKCMKSDREGKITKKSGLQKKIEENVQSDERFVLEKRYKIRFVFPNSIAVLSFIYIYIYVYVRQLAERNWIGFPITVSATVST